MHRTITVALNGYGRGCHRSWANCLSSWVYPALCQGFHKHGRFSDLLDSLDQQPSNIKRDPTFFFAGLIRECSNTRVLSDGKRIHAHILASGLDEDASLANQLVQMYLKCGSLEDARWVFDKMPRRGIVAWTAVIAAYIQHGDPKEAFRIFQHLQLEGEAPDHITFITILNTCTGPTWASLERGKLIHTWIVESGLELDVIVGNALVNMYSKCSRLEESRQIFDKMPEKNVICWTAMVTAYAQYGHFGEALHLFHLMQLDGVKPNNVTFIGILGVFSTPAALVDAKTMHSLIAESGFESDNVVGNALINMYGLCRSLEDASRTFAAMPHRDVISWNALINVHAEEGNIDEVLKLFRGMQAEGVAPDRATFLSILNAGISNWQTLGKSSELVCSCIAESGYERDVLVGNALVNLYGKCGSLDAARRIFDRRNQHNVISWTAMLGAYSHHGRFKEALISFRSMLQEGVAPNQITFVTAINACCNNINSSSEEDEAGGVSAADAKSFFHLLVSEAGLEREVDVGTALVDMYGGCGNLGAAKCAFDKVKLKNKVLWNVLIAANAKHGHFDEALRLFWRMQQGGSKPDDITMNGIVSACAHAGLVSQGCHYFASIRTDYDLTFDTQHYACMIDLLGRAGRLDEAEHVITRMPVPPDKTVRMAFLGACNTQGDRERGRRAAERVLELDPLDHSAYVALSNLYAAPSNNKEESSQVL